MGLGNLRHEYNSCMGWFLIELSRVSSLHPEHIAAEFNRSDLESQTDTEVWNLVLSRIFSRLDFPLNPPDAESTGNQDSISGSEQFPCGIVSFGI